MLPEKQEIVLALQVAHAELEVVLEKLTSRSELSLGFVETTCHALRNYLCLTRFTAQLLQDALRGHPDQDVHNWIDGLARGSELMLSTVSALEPSGAPSDVPIRWEVVDIGRMVQRFSELHRQAANAKTVALEYQMKSAAPLGWTDRVMVASIFESIFSDAVKYSPPGKRITVTLEDVASGVLCSVRDEGPGLNPEECARLFEPGAQLPPKPTGDENSRGFGLVVARQLADRLGVEIRCTSEPGKGCCVGVMVPSPDSKAGTA